MKVLISFVLALYVLSAEGKVAPDGFPQCKRSDPEIEKCFLNGLENLKPLLKTGVPSVNIPALDPLVVPTLKLDRTAPNLRLKAVIRNMNILGALKFRVDKLKLDLKNKYAGEAKIFIPKLLITADYDVKGSRLLVLDIDGKGKLNSTFTGITVVAKGIAKPIDKEGVQYLKVEKVITKLRINHGQVELYDTERPGAASSAAAFFNASPKAVLDILNPLIEDTGSAVFKAIFNKILGSIPINEILLDD